MLSLFLMKIAMCIVALCALFGSVFVILRLFDLLLCVDFKEAFNRIEEDPKAMALYYGLRILGAFLAVGLMVGFVGVL